MFFKKALTTSLLLSAIIVCASCVTPDGKLVALKEKRFASIHEIQSMVQVESYADSDVLVLFDLDNTVFESTEAYGHVNWFDDQVKQGEKNHIPMAQTIRRIYPEWIESQRVCKVRPVEPVTPSVIASLQSRGVKVMAVTARQVSLIESTKRQLSSIGVDFRKTALPAADIPANFVDPVAYSDGVLFVSELNNKSDVLMAYLQQVGYAPKRVVLVDDKRVHLEKMLDLLGKMGVPFAGLHYPFVERKRHYWNSEEAECEYKLRRAL